MLRAMYRGSNGGIAILDIRPNFALNGLYACRGMSMPMGNTVLQKIPFQKLNTAVEEPVSCSGELGGPLSWIAAI